jgi:hypothetical protein
VSGAPGAGETPVLRRGWQPLNSSLPNRQQCVQINRDFTLKAVTADGTGFDF